MTETRKLLVAFDLHKPHSRSSEFLVPHQVAGRTSLLGLESGCEYAYGLLVYLGRAITEKDVFAKLVDSGTTISSVEDTMLLLSQYLEKVQSLQIGNVVRVASGKGDVSSFELELIARTPAGAANSHKSG